MDPDFENKDFTDKDMGTADIGDVQQPSAARINTGTVPGDDNSTDTVQSSFTGESPVQEAPADSPVPGMENTAKSVSDDEYPRNIFAERDFSPAGKDPVYGGGAVPPAAGYQTPCGQPAQTPPPYAAYGAQPPYMQGATPPPPYGYGQPSPVPPYYGQNPFYAQPPYQQPDNMVRPLTRDMQAASLSRQLRVQLLLLPIPVRARQMSRRHLSENSLHRACRIHRQYRPG